MDKKKIEPTNLLWIAGVAVLALGTVAVVVTMRNNMTPSTESAEPINPVVTPTPNPRPQPPIDPPRLDLKCKGVPGYGFSGSEGDAADQFRKQCRSEGGEPVPMNMAPIATPSYSNDDERQYAGGSPDFDFRGSNQTQSEEVLMVEATKWAMPVFREALMAGPALVRNTPSTYLR